LVVLTLLLITGSATLSVFGRPASPFAGAWNVVNFSIPGQLTLQKDQNGVVTGIPEATEFKYSTGSLTVQGDGTFAGNVPDPISGTTAPGEQGTMVMYLDGTNGPGSIVFNANATADFMTAGGGFGGNSQDLILGLRAPASILPEELTGLWNMPRASAYNPHNSNWLELSVGGALNLVSVNNSCKGIFSKG
jgi:hypothetical protein